MCGRYVLAQRPSVVRQRLADQNMPADEAPADDDPQLRQSYNFAPGYHGLIYRAATNDRGTDATPYDGDGGDKDTDGDEPSPKKVKLSPSKSSQPSVDGLATRATRFKLQSAKWGLIPFWTKRPPDYGSMMRTINCRDDSLAQSGGMWNTMKQRKRCIVIAEGFYEWLKKNDGKERIPHFVKRKDGELMCLAGLWDCVVYEDGKGKDSGEHDEEDGEHKREVDKLYTYTIITTDSNKQLSFLHDRMPVIIEPGSEGMLSWLDPSNVGWNQELQSLLQPFKGELECYPVDKAVGKVGNNSPNFVIPVDSKENKKNIANFFGNAAKSNAKKTPVANTETANTNDPDVKKEEPDETRTTSRIAEDHESNAPLPIPSSAFENRSSASDNETTENVTRQTASDPNAAQINIGDRGTQSNIKREQNELDDEAMLAAHKSSAKHVYHSASKKRKFSSSDDAEGHDDFNDEDLLEAEKSPAKHFYHSPASKMQAGSPPNAGKAGESASKGVEPEGMGSPLKNTPSKSMRSATTNPTRTPTKRGLSDAGKQGNKKITSFFGK